MGKSWNSGLELCWTGVWSYWWRYVQYKEPRGKTKGNATMRSRDKMYHCSVRKHRSDTL